MWGCVESEDNLWGWFSPLTTWVLIDSGLGTGFGGKDLYG